MFVKVKTKFKTYELTANDVLWLARALWGECGRKADDQAYWAVAYCMLQRFMRWDGPRSRWPDWASFIRAFSQPVNPKWSNPGSALCKRFPRLCSRLRIKRRRTISECPWERLPRPAKRAAMLFAIGEADNPVPDAVDFGSRGLIRRQGKTGVTIGGNTFIDESATDTTWQPGPVDLKL